MLTYDSTQAAREIGVSRRHLVRLAQRLGVGQIERKVLRLTPDEVERVRALKGQINPGGARGRPRRG